MFGKNEIVGAKYFKDAVKDQLLVTSMFFTLQGEGPYRGMPAFFIRLAKCNLACSFCDTYFDSGDWMTFTEIEDKIEAILNTYWTERPEWTKTTYIDRVWRDLESLGANAPEQVYRDWTPRNMVLVITGGEPSLQKNLSDFLRIQIHKFKYTQIESNGIHTLDLPFQTTVVVSPKCSEKKGVAVKYLQPSDRMLEQAACLKFVMSADQNSPYCDIPDWAHNWAKTDKHSKPKPVFISPMNIYNREPQKAKQNRMSNDTSLDTRSTVEEVISFWEPGLLDMKSNQENHEYAAKFCRDHGHIFNMQLHLFASLA